MLKEYSSTTYPAQGGRRWYSDNYFDLIVWTGPDGFISGFQLCYDKYKRERALTWTKETGYSHERVDDGESNPAKNQTPILVPDGVCPIREIIDLFLSRSAEVEPPIRTFITDRLREYGK